MTNWQQQLQEDDDYDAWAHQVDLENRRWIEEYDRGVNKMDMTKYAGSESKWLKASDLQGGRPTVTIKSVELIEFEDDGVKKEKPALTFEGKDKGLVLNATNTEELIHAFGPDSEDWKGKKIGFHPSIYQGEPCE